MTLAAPAPGTAGPLRSVLDAVASGIPSVQGVVAATGLPRDVVEAAVDHLVRAGLLTSPNLAGSCSLVACRACPLANDGVPGCAPST